MQAFSVSCDNVNTVIEIKNKNKLSKNTFQATKKNLMLKLQQLPLYHHLCWNHKVAYYFTYVT